MPKFVANHVDEYFGTFYQPGEVIALPEDEENPAIRQEAIATMNIAAGNGRVTALGDDDPAYTFSDPSGGPVIHPSGG